MKTTNLVAVMTSLVIVGFTASEASAMYHPTLGRWAQRDAAGHVDGGNVLEYARSIPSHYVDPRGSDVSIAEERHWQLGSPQYHDYAPAYDSFATARVDFHMRSGGSIATGFYVRQGRGVTFCATTASDARPLGVTTVGVRTSLPPGFKYGRGTHYEKYMPLGAGARHAGNCYSCIVVASDIEVQAYYIGDTWAAPGPLRDLTIMHETGHYLIAEKVAGHLARRLRGLWVMVGPWFDELEATNAAETAFGDLAAQTIEFYRAMMADEHAAYDGLVGVQPDLRDPVATDAYQALQTRLYGQLEDDVRELEGMDAAWRAALEAE